ncbi:hypothetical protein MBLNU457_7228t2 [Dothideomycetes sp. NU457]
MAYNNSNYKPAIIRKDLITDVMAMDCEMVTALKNDGTLKAMGNPACWNPAGRVSITNSQGQVVLDCRMCHLHIVNIVSTNRQFSGLTWADLDRANGARPFGEVRNLVIEILSNRTVVGHDIKCDIKAMNLGDVLQDNNIKTEDTQLLYGNMDLPYGNTTKPGLRYLAEQCLEILQRRKELLAKDRAANIGKKWAKIPDPRPDADGFVEVQSKGKQKWIKKHQNAHDRAKAALTPAYVQDTTGWGRQVPELPWLKERVGSWKRPSGPYVQDTE